MKRRLCLVPLMLIAAMLAANGAPELDADGWRHYSRMDGFYAVDLRMNVELTLIPGEEWEVKARGPREDLDDLDIYVSGRTLIIRRESLFNFMSSGNRIELAVTMPSLKEVMLSSSGTIRTEDYFESGDMELILSGTGEMDIEAITDNLECDISGSGTFRFRGRANTMQFNNSGSGDADLNIRANLVSAVLTGSGDAEFRGETDQLEIRLSGSGSLRADRMPAQMVEVSVTGSGDADVRASEYLEASISGSGSVYYSGDPEHTDTRITGSGKLRKK